MRGLKTNVDESFVDIVQKGDLVLGLMGHVEARYDNWSVYGDGFWSRITLSHERIRQRTHSPALT